MTPHQLKAVVFCPTPLGIFEQTVSLYERGLLGKMVIGFYAALDRHPLKLIPRSPLRSYLEKRFHPELPSSSVASHPLPSLVAHLRMRGGARGAQADEAVFRANRSFDSWVARQLPQLGNLAFGYESSSLLTFRAATSLGAPKVLYQPIACAEFAAELLAEEAERFPRLASSLRYNYFPPEELDRRQEERAEADVILSASTFTRSSLIAQGVEPSKVRVVPYGVDQSLFRFDENKFDRFSVIWAGSFTQTKGIGYLLEAMAEVSDAELVLAGYPSGEDVVAAYEQKVRVRRVGHLKRTDLAATMARCHAHIFPTLLDGFGRNIVEAMASGLPVIATPHCAAPDLIDDGKTGFIVPIRDSEAIRDRLIWLKENPEGAVEMGLRARASIAGMTKESYRFAFSSEIKTVWEAATA